MRFPGLQRALHHSQRMCAAIDNHLPSFYRVDGFSNFNRSFIPPYLAFGQKIYDIGGGKRPAIDFALKQSLGLTVVGVDIVQEELDAAPEGAYDEIVCADLTKLRGQGDADLIICRTVLEHVEDTSEAFQAIATILRPGGTALLFVPCRNAWFARLNLLLPERIKDRILDWSIAQSRERDEHGFRAFYDRCTPRLFRLMAHNNGLEVKAQQSYFMSSYCTVFPPLFAVWRLWTMFGARFAPDTLCETFAMALQRT